MRSPTGAGMARLTKWYVMEDGTECASEGCDGYAINYMEAGGVGSHYCDDCRAKIEAKDTSAKAALSPFMAKQRRHANAERISDTIWRRANQIFADVDQADGVPAAVAIIADALMAYRSNPDE